MDLTRIARSASERVTPARVASTSIRRHAAALLTILVLSPGLLPTGPAGHASGRAHPDFNGDGFADLVVGIPKHNVVDARGNVVSDAGAVNVFYGSFNRIRSDGAQMWTEDSTLFNDRVLGIAEVNDNFGTALAWGDFDNDGFDDLAIGVPGERVAAGAVDVLYGSLVGLTAFRNGRFFQGAAAAGASILGSIEAGDGFGSALAAGDFDGDGYDDLAIGVPGEQVFGFDRAGAVNVIYGSSAGLVASANGITANQRFHQGLLQGTPETSDQFGFALAAGDFDDDGDDDLAIGVPYESVDGAVMAGAVNVILGARIGLTEQGNQFLHQNSPGLKGGADDFDRFGYSLAAASFIGEAGLGVVKALVVGIPGETVTEEDDCTLSLLCIFGVTFDVDRFGTGAIHVIYGTHAGLGDRDQIFHQGTHGIAGRMEAGDQFGSALAVGDFNGDGTQDVAVGVPYEDVDAAQNAGMVVLVPGGFGGLTAWGSQSFHQGDQLDIAEANDHFGAAMFSGDFNGDGFDDLAVSVPREDLEALGLTDTGAINVLNGTVASLSSAGAQVRVKHSVPNWVGGVPAPAAFDHFGGSSPMR